MITSANKSYFFCESLRCRLSTEACALSWSESQSKYPKRYACKGCTIGAKHANREVRTKAILECPRCGRETDRMIFNRVCVSCRNRELEVERGKNSRGARPQSVSVFFSLGERPKHVIQEAHDVVLAVDAGPLSLSIKATRAASMVEAALAIDRDKPLLHVYPAYEPEGLVKFYKNWMPDSFQSDLWTLNE